MIHDDKTRELIERYCAGVDRNVVLSRSVLDEKCVCLHRDQCKMGKVCKYSPDMSDTITGLRTQLQP